MTTSILRYISLLFLSSRGGFGLSGAAPPDKTLRLYQESFNTGDIPGIAALLSEDAAAEEQIRPYVTAGVTMEGFEITRFTVSPDDTAEMEFSVRWRFPGGALQRDVYFFGGGRMALTARDGLWRLPAVIEPCRASGEHAPPDYL